jgi:nucleotide-binding universal stress UspA family protein
MSSAAEKKERIAREKQIEEWLRQQEKVLEGSITAKPTDSRLEAIQEAADEADLVVMSAKESSGVGRFIFGSLVDSVAEKLRKTLIVVYNTGK